MEDGTASDVGSLPLPNGDFSACIHRGADQIGGTCVELKYGGSRILLDLGMPLDADEYVPSLMPPVAGLGAADPTLLALVVSHGHVDHWGLVPEVKSPLRVSMGTATKNILCAAAPFVPRPFAPEDTLDLSDRCPVQIGPFHVTPYLVDHSAYDAYALLIQAGGKRLFYSGDIRGHGRKASLFEKLLRRPPTNVDAMLLEGSSLGRLTPDESFPSESDIEYRLVERFGTPGFIALSASAQNIDRIVSVYRACKRTGRVLLLDLYAMEILRATGNDHVPGPDWPNVSVYIPEYQRRQIARNERFDLLEPYKGARIYPEQLKTLANKAVMLFRPAMMLDADRAGLWGGARAIWSQWEGYLKKDDGAKLRADLADRGVSLEVIHTSGHASIRDLQRLASAVNPKSLVPIHTFQADRYPQFFPNVVRRKDGEWWPI